MSAIPPIPPGTDLSADEGPRLIAANIVLIILPTIFVILRFISRKLARAGLWWDDALVTVALFLSWGPSIAVIISERTNGFGKHLWVLPDPARNTSQFLKILYVYVLFYYMAIVCIKLAILAFYRRIFPAAQLRIPLFIGYAVTILFGIATILVDIFPCQPIHKFWDVKIPGRCVDTDNLLLVTGGVNAGIDFLIIGLPIPLLWKLRTTTSQKGVLTGIFLCASFVCIISIIRLVVLSRLTDFDLTWNFVDAAVWSSAEPCMGVIAACMPSLRPLIAVLLRGTHRGPTLHSKSTQKDTSINSSRIMWTRRDTDGDDMDQMEGKGFTRLDDQQLSPGWKHVSHNVHVKGGRLKRKKSIPMGAGQNDDQVSMEEMVPQNGIKVKSEVTITTSDWEYKDRIF